MRTVAQACGELVDSLTGVREVHNRLRVAR